MNQLPAAVAATRNASRPGGPAVEITHLRKAYGNVVAVDDVSLSVAEGEIFGILGPNGAGKTTAVECAIGLRAPDAGTIRLLGLDPQADRDEVHQVTGVQLQASALPARLRVGEILDMYRSFYRHPADVDELVEEFGGADRARRVRARAGRVRDHHARAIGPGRLRAGLQPVRTALLPLGVTHRQPARERKPPMATITIPRTAAKPEPDHQK